VIVCQNLSKSYGDHKALQDLNLTLEAGDAFGFIGPNGAGKTTTIRILATLQEPCEGDAWVGGYSVTKEPDAVREVLGYMPDQFGLYEGMRSWEYLEFYAAAYRVPRKRWKGLIDEVLELTDLTVKKHSFVETLSTGMRQRLCLAKTLLHDPKVLVLDEPASGLDPRARIELKLLLKELSRMGKTLLVSSHILPELADFCNKVGIIEAGRLLASGPVNSILAQASRDRFRLRIRVLQKSEEARGVIEQSLQAEDLQEESDGLVLSTAVGLEGQADLLEKLVRDGFRPVEFSQLKTDLEQIFLEVTQGITQ
jgi:ABC-2 type transport system ATP-binding protein